MRIIRDNSCKINFETSKLILKEDSYYIILYILYYISDESLQDESEG